MLSFRNSYRETIWVAIMWYSPGCSDSDRGNSDPLGDWRKAGWWRIEPGQTANVLNEDLDEINRYYCYFAHSRGGAVWAGPYARFVPNSVFRDWCEYQANSDGRTVGFRLLDIGDNDDYTLNLVE